MVTIKRVIRETAKAKLVEFKEIEGEYWCGNKIIKNNQVDDDKYTLKNTLIKEKLRVSFEEDIEEFSEKSLKTKVLISYTDEDDEEMENEKFIFLPKSMVLVLNETELEVEKWIWDKAKEEAIEREAQHLRENEDWDGRESHLKLTGFEEVPV